MVSVYDRLNFHGNRFSTFGKATFFLFDVRRPKNSENCSAESRGFSSGAPVSSHRESWLG